MKKIQYNAPVTLSFFFASLAVLLAGFITGGDSTLLLFSVYRSPLSDPFFYLRLFGHVLGHSGWDHFTGNMLLLLVVGPPLEERYGSRPMIIGILVTAITTGLVQCLLFPHAILLGASGVVFFLIILSSFAGGEKGRIPLTLILVAASYLGQEIYSALFVTDNISNLTHIIGGILGILLGFWIKRKHS